MIHVLDYKCIGGECVKINSVIEVIATAFMVLGAASIWAQSASGYGVHLRQVYFAYQKVLARQEACVQAHAEQTQAKQPQANTDVFVLWQQRHASLIAELDGRLTALIKGASTTQQEFVRQIGKYESLILEYRRTERDQLLAQSPVSLAQTCEAHRRDLAQAGDQWSVEHAPALAEIRKRAWPE